MVGPGKPDRAKDAPQEKSGKGPMQNTLADRVQAYRANGPSGCFLEWDSGGDWGMSGMGFPVPGNGKVHQAD